MASRYPKMEQYEAYFKRADLDGDGQISGTEAVRFFQGSGLSKQVLAQIWSLVDRSRNGYLVRLDFYNALRLITIAQSKRDLTPVIVNAVLNSPAAAKIPAPKINLSSIPVEQPNLTKPVQVNPFSSTDPLNLGIKPKPQQNQLMRPTQGTVPQPSVGQVLAVANVPCPDVSSSASNVSYDGYTGTTSGYSSGVGGVSLASSSIVSTPESHDVWNPLVGSGKGIASSLEVVDDLFPVTSVQRKEESTQSCLSKSSPIVSASSGDQSSPLPSVLNPFESISSTSMLPAENQLQQSRPVTVNPPNGMRPLVPAPVPKHDSEIANQQRAQAPALYNPFADHLCGGKSSSSKLQEATEEEKVIKVGETQNTIVDSREKLEYYRTKMQDIMLYKSRCEKRLNEITERASADKREAETLAQKYEEKYKQLVELESKLTIKEVKFHETEGRKLELRQGILNIEQGGSADGLLQVKADRIQSDLEELMKVLSERCKKNGLIVKSKAIVEPPPGWKLGIQDGAVLWDEKWDKFDDQGFRSEISFETSKQQKSTSQKENGTSYVTGHKEDESVAKDSPAAAESDRGSHRFFDDLNWASVYDTKDDVDSIWGFNPSKSKDADFCGSSSHVSVNLGISDCPGSDSVAQRKNPFAFDDSVLPSNTPMSRLETFPPWFSDESSARNDDVGFSTAQTERLLSRLDSISNPNDFCGEKLSRLDSMNSTKDLGGSHGYSFDVADPFGSSGPFTVSSDDKSPK